MDTSIIQRPTVTWKEGLPAEIRSAVEPHLAAALDLSPRWLSELIVGWDENDTENTMTVSISAEYRWARITVTPSWLKYPAEDRQTYVEHEMMHIVQQPLYDVLDDLIAFAKEHNKDLADLLKRQFTRALERTNCDLTELLSRRRRETADSVHGNGLRGTAGVPSVRA